MSGYDIQSAADEVAANTLPQYGAKQMRALMEAAWDKALRDNFVRRRDLL